MLPLPLRIFPFFLLGLSIMCGDPRFLQAQHDPQRNSVRHIAAEQWGPLEKELAKAEADDPETLYVRMLAAVRRDRIDEALSLAEEAMDAGLPFRRLAAGPPQVFKSLHATPKFAEWRKQHTPSALLHGPMLGDIRSDGAKVWLRTLQPSEVQVVVLDAQGKKVATAEGVTTSKSDRTAVISLSGLEPNTTYAYRIQIGEESIQDDSFRLTTSPQRLQPSKFRVGIGGGAGYVPKWESMWDTVLKTKPHAFLMLGDNVYVDDPKHRLTSDYCYYRRQARPEWRRFTAQTAMYSIYDDHDFGMNDCVPGPEIDTPPWKRKVWREFRTNWVNPSYGGGEKQPGCWYDFYRGDVHFIMLDGRYYRTRGKTPTMLGPVQMKWLKQTLKQSEGRLIVLASPVPWSEGVKPGSKDPWDGFPKERQEIFDFIQENRIEGVILAAADRHRSDLRITKRPGAYDLYEFESSKLTNRHTHGVVKTPGLVWGYNKKCSFGLMEFDTTKDDPEVRFEVHNIDGELIHSHVIRRSQLVFAK